MLKRILCLILAIFVIMCWVSALHSGAYALSINQPHADDYDEYLEVIAQSDLPDYFVRYEHMQGLGEFKYYTGSYWEYHTHYLFSDSNSYDISLNINQKSLLEREETILSEPTDLADMRALPTSQRGTILRGPLRYIYNNGRLVCIRWVLGDVEFSLSGTGMFDDYPLDGEETICSRLLSRNKSTALSAYYELIKDIPLQPGETVFSRMQYRIPIVAALVLIPICTVAICIWLRIRRKRRRNAEDSVPYQR